MRLTGRHREVLRLLWREGSLSRFQVHQRTGLTANAAGQLAADLLAMNIIRQGPTEPRGPGRPHVPLRIDPDARHVLGLAIRPGAVEIAKVNLPGHPIGQAQVRPVAKPSGIAASAAALLRQNLSSLTLAIGLSIPGFTDPQRRAILLSSAAPGRRTLSLDRIYAAAGTCPLTLENDMHALAAQWMLTHLKMARQDVLLVRIADGQIGAAVLVDGRPNRGCAIGANELGHMRLAVETDECYCGQRGCLERIWSTPHLRRAWPDAPPLMELAASGSGEACLRPLLDHLSTGLANATNFIRPNRLVLVSELVGAGQSMDLLLRAIKSKLLRGLVDRVQIDLWNQPATSSPHTAAWLALANLYWDGWDRQSEAGCQKTPQDE